jgi:tRNA G46 methylase TrmB
MPASRPVDSSQSSPHHRLEEIVLKHVRSPWLKPIADHSRREFDLLVDRLPSRTLPLVLDSGCGTARSTGVLARRFSDCLVLGIDKSLSRLGRSAELPENALTARLDLEDFWLLAREAEWTFVRQCAFYPNPWPKPEHRLRRWPFHPVFPTALACGGIWELRTNWKIYADEFALAFGLLTGVEPLVASWKPEVPETAFESKYLASGHELWRVETAMVQSSGLREQ